VNGGKTEPLKTESGKGATVFNKAAFRRRVSVEEKYQRGRYWTSDFEIDARIREYKMGS